MNTTDQQFWNLIRGLLAVQTGTLCAIILFGYRVVRFFNRIEFKTDLMWKDYEARLTGGGRMSFAHRRSTDDEGEALEDE